MSSQYAVTCLGVELFVIDTSETCRMRVPELPFVAAVQVLNQYLILETPQSVSHRLSYKGSMSNENHNLRSPYQDGISSPHHLQEKQRELYTSIYRYTQSPHHFSTNAKAPYAYATITLYLFFILTLLPGLLALCPFIFLTEYPLPSALDFASLDLACLFLPPKPNFSSFFARLESRLPSRSLLRPSLAVGLESWSRATSKRSSS
jgi:hypothetical protein